MGKRGHKPKPSIIYGLVDPRDGSIFYVGKTTCPALRLAGHLRDKRNCRRVQWIRDIVGNGEQPIMITLETVEPPASWQEAEITWIAKGRALGWPLTNVSDGGDGPSPKARYTNKPRARRGPPSRRTR